MIVVLRNLWLCECCTFLAVNGDTCACYEENEEKHARHVARVADGVAELGPHLSPDFDSNDESGESGESGILEFSWTACDACHSSLGGSRHRFALLGEGEPEPEPESEPEPEPEPRNGVAAFHERVRFFHANAGGVVGERMVYAWTLAKAEERAERSGFVMHVTHETEGWDSDCPAPAYVLCCYVVRYHDKSAAPRRWVMREPDERLPWLASLGMVGVETLSDPYLDVVRAELFVETFAWLDREDQDAADALAARATFAAG